MSATKISGLAAAVLVGIICYYVLYLRYYVGLPFGEHGRYINPPWLHGSVEFFVPIIISMMAGFAFGVWRRETRWYYKTLEVAMSLSFSFLVLIILIYGACIFFHSCI